MAAPKKSLGQHWLQDRDILSSIADSAGIGLDDTVLEIGPGQGTLTSELLRRAHRVIAIELDSALARKLPGQFPGKNLEVVNQDILSFNLQTITTPYRVVANVPYYITSKIIRMLTTAAHKPECIVLLIQKEVAQRMVAQPGSMSILAISAQVYAEVRLGIVVGAAYFTPPPKVDSQVVILDMRTKPRISPEDEKHFFHVVKAGFSAKRKKLKSSIASGMHISKEEAETMLTEAAIDSDDRPEMLSIDQWKRLAAVIKAKGIGGASSAP